MFKMFFEKFHIKKASLFLRLLGEVATDTSPGHSCEKCCYVLDEAGCSVADNLPELENNLSDEVRMSLVYISGYVFKSSGLEEEDTSFYFQKHGSYFKNLDRGGLKSPSASGLYFVISYSTSNSQIKENRPHPSLML